MAQAPGRYAPGSGTDLKAQKGLRDMNGSLRRMDSAMHAELNELRRNAQQKAAYQSAAGAKTSVPAANRAVPGALERPSPVRANRQLVPTNQAGRLRAGMVPPAPVPVPAPAPAPASAAPAQPPSRPLRMADTKGFTPTLDAGGRASAAAARAADAAMVNGAAAPAASTTAVKAGGALRAAGGVAGTVVKRVLPVADLALHTTELGNSDLYKDPTQIPGARQVTDAERKNYDSNGSLRSAPPVAAAMPQKPAATSPTAADATRIARNAAMLAEFDAKGSAGAKRSPQDVLAQEYAVAPSAVQEVAPGIMRVNQQGGVPMFTNVAGGNRLPGTGEAEQPGTLRAYVDVIERQAQAAEAAGKGADARSLRAQGALAAMQEQGTNTRFDKDIDARTLAAKYTRDATLAKNQWDMQQEQQKQVAERNTSLLAQLKAEHGDEVGAAKFGQMQQVLQGVRMRAGNALQTGAIQPDTVLYQMFGGQDGKPLEVSKLPEAQRATMELLASDSPLGQSLAGIDPALYEQIKAFTEAGESSNAWGHFVDSAQIALGAGAAGAGVGWKAGGLRGALMGGGAGLATGVAHQFLAPNEHNALDQNNVTSGAAERRLRLLNGY